MTIQRSEKTIFNMDDCYGDDGDIKCELFIYNTSDMVECRETYLKSGRVNFTHFSKESFGAFVDMWNGDTYSGLREVAERYRNECESIKLDAMKTIDDLTRETKRLKDELSRRPKPRVKIHS